MKDCLNQRVTERIVVSSAKLGCQQDSRGSLDRPVARCRGRTRKAAAAARRGGEERGSVLNEVLIGFASPHYHEVSGKLHTGRPTLQGSVCIRLT